MMEVAAWKLPTVGTPRGLCIGETSLLIWQGPEGAGVP